MGKRLAFGRRSFPESKLGDDFASVLRKVADGDDAFLRGTGDDPRQIIAAPTHRFRDSPLHFSRRTWHFRKKLVHANDRGIDGKSLIESPASCGLVDLQDQEISKQLPTRTAIVALRSASTSRDSLFLALGMWPFIVLQSRENGGVPSLSFLCGRNMRVSM